MRAKPLLLAGLFGALVAGCAAPNDGPMVGEDAPDFQVTALSTSTPTSLKEIRSSSHGKVILLDFWATWCGPCKMLTPYVEDLYEKYKDKGLEAMAISNEALKDVKKFEKATPHKMPVFDDPDDVATLQYKVGGLPTVVLIGQDGKVFFEAVGFDHTLPKELEDQITKGLS